MKSFKLLILLCGILFALSACQKELIDSETGLDAPPNGPELLCYGCNTSIKCRIPCTYGGFEIKVVEDVNGVIKFTFLPRTTIYVDEAYHNQNYPHSPTCNPYTFDSFILLNTNGSSSSPWKDVNGNVIMGNVYKYKLKNPQCTQTWSTNWLHGISDPCDLNTALLHLNQASSKPNGCGNPNIICPAPPITSIPYVTHQPIKIKPTFIYYFGKVCKTNAPGLCGPTPVDSIPQLNIYHPRVGPILFEYLGEENAMQLNFTRDVMTNELEIEPYQTELPEYIINYFGLPEGTKLKSGHYPVIQNGYDFGEVVIALES